MKKLWIGLAALLFLLSLPLWSQTASSAPDFVEELHKLLESEDWSPEEIRELIQQQIDWSQASHRDAKIIALCLDHAKDSEEPAGPYEQAQIAQAVMVVAREMRALGFGERSILRTALNGTREALCELAELQKQTRGERPALDGARRLPGPMNEPDAVGAGFLQAPHGMRGRFAHGRQHTSPVRRGGERPRSPVPCLPSGRDDLAALLTPP